MFLLVDGTLLMIKGDFMIFLDTGYFKGLMDKKDIHHQDSLKIKEYLDDSHETTVINTTVLVETLNKSFRKDNVKELYDDLHAKNRVIPLTNKDYLKSIEINGWFENSINYGDCTIINTMINLGIRQIVSFDSDFEKINAFNVISSV